MSEFLIRALRDPRLAAHAIAAQGAWLWAIDGSRVMWTNAAGAALLDARSIPDLLAQRFDPPAALRLQTIQLAARLPQNGAPRLERLRGLGAPLGQLSTCSCARLAFADGVVAILIVAAAVAPRPVPFAQRLEALLDGTDEPLALFAADGGLAAANEQARAILAGADTLAAVGLDSLRGEVAEAGRAEAATETGRFALFRLGLGPETAIAAMMTPFPLRSHASRIGDAVVEPDHLNIDGKPALSEAHEPSRETSVSPSAPDSNPTTTTRPLRFVWQVDADGRFSVEGEQFAALMGAALQRPWHEIAPEIDRNGGVATAMAAGETFSSLPTAWRSVDGSTVETALSGLPVFDAARNVAGYRGFGLYRDTPPAIASPPPTIEAPPPRPPEIVAKRTEPTETQGNVLRFPSMEPRAPVLSPTENSAFDELARQLSARLETPAAGQEMPPPIATEAIAPTVAAPAPPQQDIQPPSAAAWRGESDRPLLDRLPMGILVYRLDRLLYANPAFLGATGYPSLNALNAAGGLDALLIEPGVAAADSHSDSGTPLTLSRPQSGDRPIEARLFAISWDGESAMALVLDSHAPPAPVSAPPPPVADPQAHETRRERDALRAILDVATDGIVVIDDRLNIVACNRSAQTVFGRGGAELEGAALAELFAPENQGEIRELAQKVRQAGGANLLRRDSEVLGRSRDGRFVPLSLAIGRTAGDGLVFAMVRDLSQARATEVELAAARQQSERAAAIKSDVLGKISHDIRSPLSSVIGFAELMIEERFGPLGNPRYITYLKDIRAAGERVVKLIDDLADLSRIETGKIELAPTAIALNELVEQCVALMQPQANRERIVIRSSLGRNLPAVTADDAALRKIALDLISTAIKLNAPGGQVIVSTALTDLGEVTLRIRDTGTGLSAADLAAALEPYRADKAQEQTSSLGVGLSLTRALAEANGARFEIRSAPNSGTLIEVLFRRT